MHIWHWENEDLKHWYCVTICSHCQLVVSWTPFCTRNAKCLDAGYEMPTFCHTGSNVLYSVCVCTRVLSGANCHQVQLASRLRISHNQYQPHTLHSRLLGTSDDLMTIS